MSRAGLLFAAAVVILLSPPTVAAPPMLREARLNVTFTNATTCEVEAEFSVAQGSATSLEHRLQLFEGTRVEVLEVSGASLLRPTSASGRTQVLELQAPAAAVQSYTLRYRVVEPAGREFRCPLWVPTAPANGQSLSVQIGVRLPAGATPSGGGFPAMRWTGEEASARLGHVPAFVRVPFNEPGQARAYAWNINRLMDGTAVVLLAAGMVAFIWRRRR